MRTEKHMQPTRHPGCWRIRCQTPEDDGTPRYWSNANGWTTRAEADTFDAEEVRTLRLPIDGVWAGE